MSHCSLLLTLTSLLLLLSHLNCGQRTLSCDESVSDVAVNCTLGWFGIIRACSSLVYYEFVMPPSGVVNFSTCNSMGPANLWSQEALSLWHSDNGTWRFIDGTEWENSSYCNADLNYYPLHGTCTKCKNGVHELWTVDFLNPGETYRLQIWVGPDDQHYQIDMECSSIAPSTETTQSLLLQSTIAGTTRDMSDIPITGSNDNSEFTTWIIAGSCVLCCVVILCIMITVKLRNSETNIDGGNPKYAVKSLESIALSQSTVSKHKVHSDSDATAHATTIRPEVNKKNVEEVKEWLGSGVELPQYFQVFVENGYDSMKIIIEITDKADLQEIGITMAGHQKVIMREIEKLKSNEGSAKERTERALSFEHNEGINETECPSPENE